MVPSTAGGIVGLLLILVPGVWYELVRTRSRPGRGDSTFVEASRILLAGVLISFISLVLLGCASLVNPRFLVDPQALLLKSDYVPMHLSAVAWTLAYFLVLTVTLPIVWLYNTPGANRSGEIRPESIWVSYFERIPARWAAKNSVPPPEFVYLQVCTSSGRLFRGRLSGYNNEAESGGREMALSGPELFSKDRDQSDWVSLSKENWGFVILRTEEIEDISVLYYSSPGRTLETKKLLEIRKKAIKVASRLPLRAWTLILFAAELSTLFAIAVCTR